MNTVPVPHRLLAWFATIATLPGAVMAASPADDAMIEAVWKPQEVRFVYHGSDTIYSCQGLLIKLERILLALGVRPDMEFRRVTCHENIGVIQLQVSFKSPVPATEENINAMTAYDSKDRLLARVNGETLPAPEDVPRFAAVWKTVSFSSDRKMRLESDDCELVRQLRQQVLPLLSLQVTRDNVSCSPSGNVGPPRLKVVALVAAGRDEASR